MDDNKLLMERADGIALALLDRLEQAVKELDAVVAHHKDKEKTENGEKTVDYDQKLRGRKGIVDRGGLKQLTGVLKDLEEILMHSTQLDLREREARIARLEREMDQAACSPEITVLMDGEAESYAG